MATGSKGGRSYSDPSYGSVKMTQFNWAGTCGTRGTAILSTWNPLNPISIVDWQITTSVAGTGAAASFVLAATSSLGTAALGTITLTGTHSANVTVEGTATETAVAKGGAVHLYSVLGTSDPALAIYAPRISYRETFDVSDN